MKQIAIVLGAGILVLILLVPFLPASGGNSGGNSGDNGAGAAGERAPAVPAIPTEFEAPPQWNAENLVGTAWEAQMAAMPEIDDPDSDLLIQYHFIGPGRIRLSFNRADMEGADDQAWVLFRSFLPDSEGTYRVEGAQVHVTAAMMGGERTDVIEIRGDRLYYHGAVMTPLHAGQAAPPRGIGH